MKGRQAKRFVAGAVGLAMAAFAGFASAQQASEPKGDADRAKDKVSMCIGCHGIAGYRTVFPAVFHVPMIAGQSPGYITNALKAYRAGDRSHPSMRGIASGLSDQDIADVAAYYGAAGAAAK